MKHDLPLASGKEHISPVRELRDQIFLLIFFGVLECDGHPFAWMNLGAPEA
jgi:hypothetical protein